MKNAPARIPEFSLLVLSIIFAGIFLLLQLTAQAKSQIPASQREPQPALKATPRPSPTPPLTKQPFIIEEGKPARVRTKISQPCKLPHRYRITSQESFLQFEEPTDSVLIEPRVAKLLVARIDTPLKPGVYPVMVNVECLDCGNEPRCPQIRNAFVIELTVKPSAQTPPSAPQTAAPLPPAPSNGEGATSTEDDKEARELSKHGPQFPNIYNLSDFSFKGFVKGGWPFFIDYELERPGHVTLTITAKNAPPFTYEFEWTSAGRHEKIIKLPMSLGGGPVVASYAIKAVSERSANAALVPLIIWALAAGDRAVGSSEIDRVTLSPRDIRIVRGNPAPKASYSFRVRVPFSGGAQADIRLLNGVNSEQVYSQFYDRHLTAGDVISGEWNCKRGGQPSLGRHELFVKAWYTIEEGDGAFGHAISLPVVVR